MRRWIGRIMEGIETGVFVFIIVSILNKLILKREDWLFETLALSVPYVFALPITYYTVGDKKYKKWSVVILTTVCVFIGGLFVLGVCLSINECWWKTLEITFYSAWAMAVARIDESRDEKRTTTKPKEVIDIDVIV